MRKNLDVTFIHTTVSDSTCNGYMIKYVRSIAKIVKEMDCGRSSYLFIYLFIYLSIYLSICLFICSVFGYRHLQFAMKILLIYEKQ